MVDSTTPGFGVVYPQITGNRVSTEDEYEQFEVSKMTIKLN